jgi:hypothetical protein
MLFFFLLVLGELKSIFGKKRKKKKINKMKVHRLDQRSANKGFVKIVWNFE